MATYKILKATSSNEYITLDYLGLCEHRGLKPIVKTAKRRIINLASIYSYPSLTVIAEKAKFTNPLDDSASSKRLTSQYVKHFLATNHLKL